MLSKLTENNRQQFWISVKLFIKKKMTNMLFPASQCDLQLFSVGWEKQVLHLGLWEHVMEIFHYFPTFYRQNNESIRSNREISPVFLNLEVRKIRGFARWSDQKDKWVFSYFCLSWEIPDIFQPCVLKMMFIQQNCGWQI